MDEDDKWAQKARLRLGALKKSIDDDEDLQDARNMSLAARLNRARPSQASQPDDDDDDEDLQEAIGTFLQNPGEADAIQAASLLDSSYQSQAAGPGPGEFLSDAQRICMLKCAR